jgi:hypothetical protein
MCGGKGQKERYNTTGQTDSLNFDPCPMCGGQGYVEDVIEPTNRELTEYALEKFKEVDQLRKRLDKIIKHAQAIISNGGNNNLACKMLRIASGQEDGDTDD